MAVTVVVAVLLHPLNDFFCFYGITQYLQQIDNLHIPVGGISQSILHPFVGLAAYIDKQVAIWDFNNIISGRLIAVQVNAVIQQHCDFCVISLVTKDFPNPVIFRKNGGDNAQFISLIGIILLSAAGKSADKHEKRKQQRSYLFHDYIYLRIIIRT